MCVARESRRVCEEVGNEEEGSEDVSGCEEGESK